MAAAVPAARVAQTTTASERVITIAHQLRSNIESYPMLQHRLQIISRQLSIQVYISSGKKVPLLLAVEPEHQDQLAYTKKDGPRPVIRVNGREVIARNIRVSADHVVPDFSGLTKMIRGLVYHEMGHIMLTPRWVDDFPAATFAFRQNIISLRTFLEGLDPTDVMEFVMLYYVMASYLDREVISEETLKGLHLQPFMARVSGRMGEIISPWLGERVAFEPPPSWAGEVTTFIESFGPPPDIVQKVADLEKEEKKTEAEIQKLSDQAEKEADSARAALEKRQEQYTKMGITKRIARRQSTTETEIRAAIEAKTHRRESVLSEISHLRQQTGHGGEIMEALKRVRAGEPPDRDARSEEQDVMELLADMLVKVMKFDKAHPETGCRVKYYADATPEHQRAKERIHEYFATTLASQTIPAGVNRADIEHNFDTLLERAIGVMESQSMSDTAGNAWVMVVQSFAPQGDKMILQFAGNRNIIEDQRLETQLVEYWAGMGDWFAFNIVQAFNRTYRYGLTAGRLYLEPAQLLADKEVTRLTGREDPTKPPIEGMLDWFGPIARVYVPLISPAGPDKPNDVVLMGHIQSLYFLFRRIFWPTETDLLAPLSMGIEPGELVEINAPVPTGMRPDEQKRVKEGTKERAKILARVEAEETKDPFDKQRKILAAVLQGMSQWTRRRTAIHAVMDDLGIKKVEPPKTAKLPEPLKLPTAPPAPPPTAAPLPGGPAVASVGAKVPLPGTKTLGPQSPPADPVPTGAGDRTLALTARAVAGSGRVLVVAAMAIKNVAPRPGTEIHVRVTATGVTRVVKGRTLTTPQVSRSIVIPLVPDAAGKYYPENVDIYDLPADAPCVIEVWATAPNKGPGPVKRLEATPFA